MIIDLDKYHDFDKLIELTNLFREEITYFKDYSHVKKFYKKRRKEMVMQSKDSDGCNIDFFDDKDFKGVDWLIVAFYNQDNPDNIDNCSKKIFKNSIQKVLEMQGVTRCGFTYVGANSYVPEHVDEDDRNPDIPAYNVICTINQSKFLLTTEGKTIDLSTNRFIGLNADNLHKGVNKSKEPWIAILMNIERKYID